MTTPRIPDSHSRVCSLLIVLIAFALRLYRLDAQSIWVDEGISLHLATSSVADIVANRAANIHPPLYFFLLKGWMALTGVASLPLSIRNGTGVFTSRFFSAMAGLLQVAVVYAVARRWFRRPTARIAAFITALSPLSIIYAQEIRAYALLPLVYLALLAITHKLTRKPPELLGFRKTPRVSWLLLGVVEVVGLHLHYTVLFLVAYTGCWSLLSFCKQKRWTDLRRWVITQLLVGVACLPWLLAVLIHWPAVQARLEMGRGLTASVPLDYVLSQVWVFHLTGLAGALGRPVMRLFAGLIFLLLLALLLLRLREPSARRTTASLAAHWLIPLSSALLVWIVRPFSHPRYVALFAPGLVLLAAYTIVPMDHVRMDIRRLSPNLQLPSSIFRTALIFTLLLLSLLGLRAYFFDPAFARDDVRGVARYLEEVAGPNDLILVPDGDWSLTFAYRGEALIKMPGLPDEEETWANLARWTASRRRVFVMSYEQGIAPDRRGMIPFALERAGTLRDRQSFGDILVHLYELERSVGPPALTPIDARFGSLTLTDAWVELEAPVDTALTLALRWHLPKPTDHTYGLTLRLLDVDHWPLAARDGPLLDEQIRPTDRWSAGQETTTYHVLPVPSGTPPLTYTVTVGLYERGEDTLRPVNAVDSRGAPQGQHLELLTVRLTAPLGITGNPYRTRSTPPSLPQPVELANGLRLLGAALDRSTLSPGQSLFVILHWQATRSPLPDLRPRLALVQSDQELDASVSAPALGRYPTDRWHGGETVVEHRQLTVPPTTAAGPAEVALTLQDQSIALGQIEISAVEHTFTRPAIAYPVDTRFGQVARLIGYDLPSQTLTAGEPITLTLYWQALDGASGADYAVFAHILADDGHLVGQHDGAPACGTRPTTGWVPDEIITDRHAMTFRGPYVGPARIEVGLYHPATMERVPAEGRESFALLPTALTISEH